MKKVFTVNMFGTFLITKAVVEVMKERKYGRIVSLSSVSAKRGGDITGEDIDINGDSHMD